MSGEGNNEASGGGLIRGGAMDGDAINQRGEGAGDAEPSTPGREVVHLARGPGAGVECNTLAHLKPAVAYDERAAVTCTGCLHTLLALNEDGRDRWRHRAEQAESRVAELEAAARWVPVGERLPESGTTVLAMIDWPAGVATSPPWVWLCKFNLQRFRLCDGPFDWNMTSRVTHWRPLPAGPEVQP